MQSLSSVNFRGVARAPARHVIISLESEADRVWLHIFEMRFGIWKRTKTKAKRTYEGPNLVKMLLDGYRECEGYIRKRKQK